MERAVVIQDRERVTAGDFTNFGKLPRESIDHIVYDALLKDAAFIGFNCTGAVGSALLTVGAGRLYSAAQDGTPVYFNSDDGGVTLNMVKDLPVLTRKKVAVYAYPNPTDGAGEARTFLTDAKTRDTIARTVSTMSIRRAEIRHKAGEEAPDPVAPALPDQALQIAEVLVDANGILTITRLTENLLPNLRDVDNARKENLSWRARTGTKIDTLGSDISALAQRLKGTASDEFVREIAGDVAVMKTLAQLPASYSSYDADGYLTDDKTEVNHVDNLSKIQEGIRFAYAAQSDSQLGLLNSLEPKLNVQNFWALPAFTESIRMVMETANDTEQSLSAYTFINQTIVQKTRTVARIRYGGEFTVCTNNAGWWAGTYRDFWGNVIKDGQTYQVLAVNPIGDFPGHDIWRLQGVWTDYIQEAYWDVVTTTDSANGCQTSQSFLNTQDGWLTSVDLLLTKLAGTGDITVLITETTNAAPDTKKVLTKQVIPFSKLKVGANNFPIPPTLCKKGERYGVFFITGANHFVGITKNNKYAGGSMFINSDGQFQVGNLTEDLCMGLRFAKFTNAYVEVDLLPLTLGGGIGAIDIIGHMAIPAGTQLFFSILDPANNTWKSLDQQNLYGAALNGLPPLVKFKVTLVGTPDIMPGFDTSYQMRVMCHRIRPDGRHISKVRTLPAPCKNFSIKIRLEAWRGVGFHTHDLKLLTGPLLNTGVGDTVVTRTTMTEVPAPDDPTGAVVRTYTFVLASAVSTFRMKQEITTSNVLTAFHVASRIDIDQP